MSPGFASAIIRPCDGEYRRILRCRRARASASSPTAAQPAGPSWRSPRSTPRSRQGRSRPASRGSARPMSGCVGGERFGEPPGDDQRRRSHRACRRLRTAAARSSHGSAGGRNDPVQIRISRSSRSGALIASHWPTMPPIDKPAVAGPFELQIVHQPQHVAAEIVDPVRDRLEPATGRGRGCRTERAARSARAPGVAVPTSRASSQVSRRAAAPAHRSLRRARGGA